MIKIQDIEDHAFFAMRKAQMELLNTERLGITHVTDVVSPCMRNVIYKKILPSVGASTEDVKSLLFGQAIHKTTILGKKEYNELFLGYNWVKDEPITLEEARKIPDGDPKHLDIIYGSIDDVLEFKGDIIIADKKTTGAINYFKKDRIGASDQHKAQINVYRVLLKKCYDMDAKWGCDIYIPNSISKEERDIIVPKAFKLNPIEETLTTMIEQAKFIKASMTKKILPERTKCFLCNSMCPYATKCFTDERESFAD